MPFWENVLSGLPIIGTGIQAKLNSDTARENTNATNRANAELAKYQYSKDLEMWNRGNAYNDPLAQMQRLKRAGLNPNLVYGSGSPVGMQAGQLPKYNAPTMSYNYQPPVDLPSMLSAFQDYRLANAQISNVKEQQRQREIGNLSQSAMHDVRTGDFGATQYSRMPVYLRKALTEADSKMEALNQQRKLGTFQPEILRLRNLESQSRANALIQGTENTRLQNEWFAEKAISQIFSSMLGGAKALVPKIGMRRGK